MIVIQVCLSCHMGNSGEITAMRVPDREIEAVRDLVGSLAQLRGLAGCGSFRCNRRRGPGSRQ